MSILILNSKKQILKEKKNLNLAAWHDGNSFHLV